MDLSNNYDGQNGCEGENGIDYYISLGLRKAIAEELQKMQTCRYQRPGQEKPEELPVPCALEILEVIATTLSAHWA